MSAQKKMTGETLVQMGIISQDQLDAALSEQSRTREKLGRILVQRGILTEQQLIEALEFLMGIPHIKMSNVEIDSELLKMVPINLIRMHRVLPVSRRKNTMTLAMSDPQNQKAIDDIQMATGLNIIPVFSRGKRPGCGYPAKPGFSDGPQHRKNPGGTAYRAKNPAEKGSCAYQGSG
jgi:GSPII_E N-terminal domain.